MLGQVRHGSVYIFFNYSNWTLLQGPGGPQDPLFCCGFLCMGHVAPGRPVAAVGPVFSPFGGPQTPVFPLSLLVPM